MITLITGIPGSGKTAYVVSELLKVQNRPIFVDGIPDLAIDHSPCPPVKEWTEERDDPSSASGKKTCFTFPPNSIIVIDECQRVYRPRAVGSKVPAEVSAFETHRHEGLDFWLITQNPTLLDANVRKLVGRHVHFRVTWAGRYMHEWAETADVESSTARSNAATTRYKLPKQAFTHYKSAVLHTKHKAKIPYVFWVFLLAVLSFGYLGYRLYNRFQDINAPVAAQTSAGTIKQGAATGVDPQKHVRTLEEYVADYKPRIEGLAHTAPIYDEITKPKQAPEITGCVERKKDHSCTCYDQQGNHYRTTPQVCTMWMKEGIFYAWKEPPRVDQRQQERLDQPKVQQPAPVVQVLESSGGVVQPAKQQQVTNDSTNPKYNVALRQ